MIIATAGHVDHGKTSLVHALTGVDTDRLPEEKRRGLTIDLGFAYTDLAYGVRAGFVDVPGHHRFVANMVAGVTGVDAALVVVAADDGVMPQTAEHVAILDLLGIDKGVVAITKSDKVEADRLQDVSAEITALLRGSSLENFPLITTSTATGLGIEALKHDLVALTPNADDDDRTFRLAVDRSFVLDGAGVILSGPALSGAVQVGDEVLVMPAGIPVSVRGLRVQNSQATGAATGDRCAIQIGGRWASRDVARRGDWLCAPGTGNASRRVDVRIQPARTLVAELRHDMPVHIHIGAADIPGRLALLDRRRLLPGEEAWGQLVLDREISSAWGDRFILRDQSAQVTIAGGWVVDPVGAARGRARPERLRELAALALPSPSEALEGLLAITGGPVDLPALARRRALRPDTAQVAWARVETVRAGNLAFEPRHWTGWRDDAVAALETAHHEHPDQLGLDAPTIARALGLKAPETRLLLEQLAAQGVIRSSFGIHRLPEHRPRLAPADQTAWENVRATLGDAETPAQVAHQIARQLEWEPEQLLTLFNQLERQGLLIRISRNRFLLPETVMHLAKAAEAAAKGDTDGLSLAGFRARAKVGRNLAVEFLEFLDRRKLTRRDGARRALISSLTEIFNI